MKRRYEETVRNLDAEIAGDGGFPGAELGLSRVVLACGSNIEPEPIEWLWKYWLAFGKFHLLAGAPGQGKTTISIGSFAATVTSGGPWPDGTRCEPGNVIVWSGEDDIEDTLLPRFIAAGGDRSRIFFAKETVDHSGTRSFDPSRDMLALLEEIRKAGGASLVILDPVVNAVAGDSHKNTEVRRALQPLVDAAAEGRFAVLGVTHLSKGGQGGDPTLRVIGSIAFAAVPRVVMLATRMNSDDGVERRLLIRSKSNIGPDDGGFEYRVEQIEPLPGIVAPTIVWGAPIEGTASDLLNDPRGDGEGSKSALATAKEFVISVLSSGPRPSKSVEVEATLAGVSLRTLRRAADELGVMKRKVQQTYYWSLETRPAQLGQVGQVAQREEVGQTGQAGQADSVEVES